MKGEFKAVLWGRILALLLLPLPIFFFYFAFAAGTTISKDADGFTYAITYGMFPVLGLFFLFIIAGSWMSKLIIDDEKITSKEIYGTRVLYAQEIKGYRVDNKYLHIVPKNASKKGIRISTYTQSYAQILAWVVITFNDLDLAEAAIEEEEILADQSLGKSTEERSAKLGAARKVAKYFNIAGGIVGAWTLFFPNPYMLAVAIAIILPIAGYVVMMLYRGLIMIDEKKNSPYPSVMPGIVFPAAGLSLRALFDYDLLYTSTLWYYVIGFAALVVYAMIETTRPLTKGFTPPLTLFGIAMICMSYSYGAYVMLNCTFDPSEPEMYQSKVIDKEVTSGKTTTYYLLLEPWGPFTAPEKATVSRSQFQEANIGDIVNPVLKQGLLQTQWYYVITD